MNWFKKLNVFMKIIVVILVLFVGSAVVAGMIDGITGEEVEEETEEQESKPDNETEEVEDLDTKEVAKQEEKEAKEKKEKEEKERKKQKEKEKRENKKEKEVKKQTESKKQNKKQTIEVDQTLNSNNLELEVQTATVEDGVINIPIWWKHWNMYDKAHLSLVAHPVVKQDDKELEVVSGESDLLEQKKQMTPARANMKYKLIDESTPVTVSFLDIREEIRDEEIEIDID